jgi:hypothetical protein
MTLTAAEHQRVKRETMQARNAGQRYGRGVWRRTWAWVQDSGAVVRTWEDGFGRMYGVRVPGFHEQCARRLPDAVEQARSTVADFLASGAAKGPTGAKLDRLRSLQEAGGG